MKRPIRKVLPTLLLLLTVAVAAGCSSAPTATSEPTKKPKIATVEDIVNAFENSGIPIAWVEVYTAETDPNELLGRPGQYIAKANWADDRLEQSGGDPRGGTVELFKSQGDLRKRKEYIETVIQAFPPLAEYIYAKGNALLRLDHGLTPAQAAEYQEVFESLDF